MPSFSTEPASFLVAARSDDRQRHRYVTAALEARGHSVSLVALHPPARFLRQVCAIIASRRRDPKPAAIILVGIGPKMLAVHAAAKFARLPVIARLGGDPFRATKERAATARMQRRYRAWAAAVLNRWTAAWLLRRVSGCIVVNRTLVPPIGRRLSATAPIAVAPQFCPGPAQPRRSYRLGAPVSLLTVTNLRYSAKADGVLWIADRLAELAESAEAPLLEFRVAGGGQHLDALRSALAARRIPAGLDIHLLGFVPDVDGLLVRSDIFLYRSEHDATPNVLLESKRFGLPALVNASEAFGDIVSDAVDGLVYAGPEAFRAQLQRLLRDEDLRRSLGEAALADHGRRFCVESSGRLLEAALARILDPGASRTAGTAGLETRRGGSRQAEKNSTPAPSIRAAVSRPEK